MKRKTETIGLFLAFAFFGMSALALPPKKDGISNASSPASSRSSLSSGDSQHSGSESADFESEASKLPWLIERFSDELTEEAAKHLAAEFARRVTLIHLSGGERLFSKGDAAEDMHFLVKGCVAVVSDGETKATLKPGAIIGEMALISRDQRSADAVCTMEGAQVFQLTRHDFETLQATSKEFRQFLLSLLTERLRQSTTQIQTRSLQGSRRNNGGTLPQVKESSFKECSKASLEPHIAYIQGSILDSIPLEDLKGFCRIATLKSKKGYNVFSQGETTTGMYLVLRGQVVITVDNGDVLLEVAKMEPRQHFGEMAAFAKGKARTASASTAPGETVLLYISEENVTKLAQEYPLTQLGLLQTLVRHIKANNGKYEFKQRKRPSSGVLTGVRKKFLSHGKPSSESDNKVSMLKRKDSLAMRKVSGGDVIRSLMPDMRVIPNAITINGKSFYDEQAGRRFGSQFYFFFALLKEMQDAGMRIGTEEEIATDIENFLAASKLTPADISAFEKERERTWLDVLKLCSISAFSQALNMLRDTYKNLLVPPWDLRKEQGITLHIRIEPESITVTQCFTYDVKMGKYTNSPTLARIPFSWSTKLCNNGKLEAAIYNVEAPQTTRGILPDDEQYILRAFKHADSASTRRLLSRKAISEKNKGIADYNAIRARFANLPSFEEIEKIAATTIDEANLTGDCLVEAVAFQLGLQNEERDTLRHRIATYMHHNLEELRGHFPDADPAITCDSIEEYIDAIKQPLVWGDELMVRAIAGLFERPVIVFNAKYPRGLVIYNPYGPNQPLIIHNLQNRFITAGPDAYWEQRLHNYADEGAFLPAAAAANPGFLNVALAAIPAAAAAAAEAAILYSSSRSSLGAYSPRP